MQERGDAVSNTFVGTTASENEEKQQPETVYLYTPMPIQHPPGVPPGISQQGDGSGQLPPRRGRRPLLLITARILEERAGPSRHDVCTTTGPAWTAVGGVGVEEHEAADFA